MELLLSNLLPGKYPNTRSSRDVFERYIKDIELLRLAVGYISSDSLIELKKIVEINKRPKIELLIGMHYFDGFSRPQYQAAKALNETLLADNLGFVKLSNTVKFHGKIYSFINDGDPVGCFLGSSNLNSVTSHSSINYEADLFIENLDFIRSLNKRLTNLIDDLGTPLEEVSINSFIEYNGLLENQYGVKKIPTEDLLSSFQNKTNIEFDIPIKSEPKSNLNIFFGKGRVTQRGFEMPRPWYEVELIVSKKITENDNYPSFQSFEVITDDGWSFSCKTSGDYSKNFRSEMDLKILGKWIKGRLENNGALIIGEPVTDDVLRNYGSSNMKLIKSNKPNLWLLEFKPNAQH